jgi:hypothetical protein
MTIKTYGSYPLKINIDIFFSLTHYVYSPTLLLKAKSKGKLDIKELYHHASWILAAGLR